MNKKNKLIIISGASGVGKTVVALGLLKENKKLKRVVTYTTRKKRPGEVAGQDYYFVSENKFNKMVKSKEFFEYARVHNDYYGNAYQEIKKIKSSGQSPVLVIDVQGGLTVKKKIRRKERLMIFLMPESKEQLKQRIKKRKGNMSKKDLELRMRDANKEMKLAGEYDYTVVNKQGKLEETINRVVEIIKKENFLL
ncbi:guanylate kinase [Candidatus Roizmanbacteria bacterium RIFCSPHIGHO2_12_FULL_37_9b]|uniref:Guanylate kinase n=1 Tax=Candidatus Kuenenbacteria bacterium RIFCSPHIGHO2_02_FULL_39_13 TaxID=1798561 RepID=A0A1F6FMF2_9BACT|nr:MAG: guanylate kinase [Candidatus Kuenenbacteria bacterium RIFCSPHIGHO2_02_FULL_39_13]OGK33289.1 MAG: guanylate kinase [Candidatus Roizmanbacteria bacterium RIFCSPHIGHO2_12_FULL_37_9b]